MARKSKIEQKHVMTILLVFFMVSSVFGVIFYGFTSNEQKQKYNGITFSLTSRGVEGKIAGKRELFSYFPADVLDIELPDDIKNSLTEAQAVYITYNPNSSSVQEIAIAQYKLQDFFSNQNKYAITAMTKDGPLPTITCENASAFVPVVELKEAESTTITSSNNCVLIEVGTDFDYERIVDRIRFALLGVIE